MEQFTKQVDVVFERGDQFFSQGVRERLAFKRSLVQELERFADGIGQHGEGTPHGQL
jgi:hypothetical protein